MRRWAPDLGRRLVLAQTLIHDLRHLLAPICGWFTDGFETPDLKEANAPLEELR
jgi:hypothetical protein